MSKCPFPTQPWAAELLAFPVIAVVAMVIVLTQPGPAWAKDRLPWIPDFSQNSDQGTGSEQDPTFEGVQDEAVENNRKSSEPSRPSETAPVLQGQLDGQVHSGGQDHSHSLTDEGHSIDQSEAYDGHEPDRSKYRKKKKKRKSKRKRRHELPTEQANFTPHDLSHGVCDRQRVERHLGEIHRARLAMGTANGNYGPAIGGTTVGMMVPGPIGHAMDPLDHACVGQTLEYMRDGQVVAWNTAYNGMQYRVMPLRTFQIRDGRYCREYATMAAAAGRMQQVRAIACRWPDGAWQVAR